MSHLVVIRCAAKFALALLVSINCAGCASTSHFTTPGTLQDVNEALEGRWAVIEMTAGEAIDTARDVEVTLETTSYTDRLTHERQHIRTSDVLRITVRNKRGWAGKGALIGTVPGLVLIGKGLYMLSTMSDTEGPATGLLAFLAVGWGAIAVPVGAVAGVIIGGVADRGEVVVVYEGPVRDYLQE